MQENEKSYGRKPNFVSRSSAISVSNFYEEIIYWGIHDNHPQTNSGNLVNFIKTLKRDIHFFDTILWRMHGLHGWQLAQSNLLLLQ